MTHQELNQLIGKEAQYQIDGLRVSVRITDARQSFGRIDVQIEPMAGSGAKWVQLDSLQIEGRE